MGLGSYVLRLQKEWFAITQNSSQSALTMEITAI